MAIHSNTVLISKNGLKFHEKKHKNQCKSPCSVCKKEVRKDSLTRHMEIHSNVRKTFTCNECPAVLMSKIGLRIHEQKHKDEYKRPCPVCKAQITSTFLKRHVLLHTDTERERANVRTTFKCKECPSVLASKEGLRVHEKIHKGKHRKPCPICKVKITSNNLSRHMLQHDDKEKPKEKCPRSCKELFASSLQQLVPEHWELEQPVFICPTCEKHFSTLDILRKHRRTVHFANES